MFCFGLVPLDENQEALNLAELANSFNRLYSHFFKADLFFRKYNVHIHNVNLYFLILVIKLLLVTVEEEIFQAKKSLLQAAASFPMYGRVHCITGALQQVPLK